MHKQVCLLIAFCVLLSSFCFSQKANKAVQQGNDAYRKADFSAAINDYRKALAVDNSNAIAQFNLANALQQSHNNLKATEEYNEVIKNAGDALLQSKAYYNKGLSLVQQKNMPEAINAFKQALRLAPGDNDARENLQKAIEEIKQQQPPPPPQQQQTPKKEKQQPKMNMQMMEQKFKELQDQEKQLQKELQRQKTNQPQSETDW